MFINNSLLNNYVIKYIPGQAAVRLIVSSVKLSSDYIKTLSQAAQKNELDIWVKGNNHKFVEFISVGSKEGIDAVIRVAWKSICQTNVELIKVQRFDKIKDDCSNITMQGTSISYKEDTSNKYIISFAGDTTMGDYFLSNIAIDNGENILLSRLEKDPLSFIKGVKPLIENSDQLIINLETVLSENPKKIFKDKNYPIWDNPERTIAVLQDLGVTAVTLANNHTMDFGYKLLLETEQKLRRAGISAFGCGRNPEEASRPLTFQLTGENHNLNMIIFTGMLASKRYWKKYHYFATEYNYGVNPLNVDNLQYNISRLREEDSEAIIIICPHWQGYDYKWVSPQLKNICRSLIAAGANYIFAHGNHMANHIELMGNGIIAYSMGNFVFVSPGDYAKYNAPPFSLIINVHLEEIFSRWKSEVRFYPIVTDNISTGYNTRIVDENEILTVYNIFNRQVDNNSGYITSYTKKKDAIGSYLQLKF